MKRFLGLALLVAACSPDAGSSDPAAPTASASPPAAAAKVPPLPVVAGPYAPKDECASLPGWAEFRARLRAAVKARDAAAVAALANPSVELDYGGGSGRAALIARLTRTDGAPSLWSELEAFDALGCAYDKQNGTAVLPWFFQQDLTPHDPFGVLLAAGPDVILLTGPNPKTQPLARLSWALVEPVGNPDWDAEYLHVSVIGRSQKGYVAARMLRSPIDYRLLATHGAQGWQIDAFIAGD